MPFTPQQVARHIDHTILKAEATEAEVRKVVAEAVQHRFASVCVNGRWANLVSDLLAQAGVGDLRQENAVATCVCVGFPLGAGKSTAKAIEASMAVKDGAQEIDMVIAVPALIDGDLAYARNDVAEVVKAARAVWPRTVVKVILETAALTEPQIALGCQAAREGGADFVKTSTGFHPKGGATPDTVALLVKYGKQLHGMKVKAAGGIRDMPTAQAYLAAGADRLGCSAGVAIVTAGTGGSGY